MASSGSAKWARTTRPGASMAEYEVGTAGSRGIEGIITSHEWVASSESEVVVLEGFWGEGREKEPTREEEGRCEFASRAGRGESEFHLVLEPPDVTDPPN